MKDQLFMCMKCELKPCFRQSRGSAMSDDGEIVKHCEHRSHYKADYKMTTKYQITETPEPVYYLDIPEELRFSVEGFLYNHNGLAVKIIDERAENSIKIIVAGANRTVLKSWIKQKQPEPTREELQERINTARGYITRNPDSIGSIAYEELTEILGKKEKRP